MELWKIHKVITGTNADTRRQDIIKTLFKSRHLTTPKAIDEFLDPPLPSSLTPKQVGISESQLNKAINRIKTAIKLKQSIIVYGDYDADGVCSTAIMWEALHSLGANVLPFIPERQTHGYGLSKKGIDAILDNPSRYWLVAKPSLIITVDNGIVAHFAVTYAKKKGFDIIVTDHHVPTNKLPPALAIVHTTKLSGAGVAWFLAENIRQALAPSRTSRTLDTWDTLSLAAIGTVADMVPLLGPNRSIVKHGLKLLAHPKRLGLIQLFKQAGIEGQPIDTYTINFVIAPRLNAMGRLGHALDSLRLLCTPNQKRATELAQTLSLTNRDRQELTEEQLLHAKDLVGPQVKTEKLIIVGHKDYHEGVIGLIAGKLVETYWRPAIVLSQGATTSKASARSIPGFNIIEALREASDLLVDVGGHPMAAGFTVENQKLTALIKRLQKQAHQKISPEHLKRSLDIDCQISLSDINWSLYQELEKFEPFGMANPRPIFATKNVAIISARTVGRDKQHLKLKIKPSLDVKKRPGLEAFNAIGFGLGERAAKINPGSRADLAYNIDFDQWNGHNQLQLKLKDLRMNT